MTAVTQKDMWDVVKDLPEDKKLLVFNFAVTLKEPEKKDVSMRIGAGQGEFNTPDDFDENNEEIVDTLMRYALS
jgi:hypothetical protein